MKEVVCVNLTCNKKFIKKHNRQQYCSKKCALEAKRATNRNWMRQKRKYQKEKNLQQSIKKDPTLILIGKNNKFRDRSSKYYPRKKLDKEIKKDLEREQILEKGYPISTYSPERIAEYNNNPKFKYKPISQETWKEFGEKYIRKIKKK